MPLLRLSECLSVLACKLPGIKAICRELWKEAADATRQPEQVRAFRDTWKLGIHSYLAYLRDRLIVARDLLTETGSVFVQIGDENLHLVRNVLDEVFGSENLVSSISVRKTGGTDRRFSFRYSRLHPLVRPREDTMQVSATFFETHTGRSIRFRVPEHRIYKRRPAQGHGR